MVMCISKTADIGAIAWQKNNIWYL
jgi:hypothetical protein